MRKDGDMDKIKAVKVDPGCEPETVELSSFEDVQNMVDGYVEGHVIPGTPFMLYVNEDGYMRQLPINRPLNGHVFCGTMVVCKLKNGEDVTMSETDIEEAKELLS